MREEHIDISELDIPSWRRVKRTVRLRLFELKDGSSWEMPAAIIAGKKPGPIVTVVAGQHGDEYNGIFVAHRLFEEIELYDLDGTLVILPIANPFAFLQKSRTSTIDQIDINRSYSSGGERCPTTNAGALMVEYIFRKSNYVVDIHTGRAGTYLPNVGVVEQGRFGLGAHFNTGVVIVAHKDRGTLVAACERNSVPAFSIQLGHALEIDYEACESVTSGIINFFRGVDLIPEPPQTLENQKLYTDKRLVLAPLAGFITLDVALDQKVKEGQRVGEIEPLFGDPVEIIAPGPGGHVIFARHEPIISRGDGIIHVAGRGGTGR